MNNWQVGNSDTWEYSRYVFNWQRNTMEVGGNKLDWNGVWDMFGGLGNEGWEMISCNPLSSAGYGHEAGDTNLLLFVFKRRKGEIKM